MERTRRVRGLERNLVLGSLAMLVLGACAREEKQQPPSPPRIEQTARSAAYSMEHLGAGKIRLRDGAYRDTVVELSSKLISLQPGDLDGDGHDDAAVVLATEAGGTGTFVDLYAALDRDSGVVTRGPASLGDRVKIDSLRIRDHRIAVHLLTHGPNDPLCCPTQHVVQHYAFVADTLERVPQELP